MNDAKDIGMDVHTATISAGFGIRAEILKLCAPVAGEFFS